MFESLPDILTVKQLQDVLQIGRNTAYHLIENGELFSIRIGRTIRIPKKSLLEYVQSSCYDMLIAQTGSPSRKEDHSEYHGEFAN